MRLTRLALALTELSQENPVIDNTDQALIALGEHPKNPECFCLHVTGLSDKAIQEPPDFTELPGDFLIYRNGRALKGGYQKPYRLKYQLR